MQGVMCGDAMLMGLLWQGRLGELVLNNGWRNSAGLGVPTSRWHCPDAASCWHEATHAGRPHWYARPRQRRRRQAGSRRTPTS